MLDPHVEARLHVQLSKIYSNGFEGQSFKTDAGEIGILSAAGNDGADQPEEGYEFRLFSRPSSKPLDTKALAGSHQRIVLRSPSPINDEPGFLKPRRSEQYYYTGVSTAEKLEHYRMAAVTWEEIVRGLNNRYVGSQDFIYRSKFW